MSKKSNVHPDHYKTAGRDRPDDAARARLNRAIAAKSISQQHPDRMSKGFYFERPEQPGFEAPAAAGREEKSKPKPKQKASAKTTRAKKARAETRKTRPSPAKKSRKAAARPAKKR